MTLHNGTATVYKQGKLDKKVVSYYDSSFDTVLFIPVSYDESDKPSTVMVVRVLQTKNNTERLIKRLGYWATSEEVLQMAKESHTRSMIPCHNVKYQSDNLNTPAKEMTLEEANSYGENNRTLIWDVENKEWRNLYRKPGHTFRESNGKIRVFDHVQERWFTVTGINQKLDNSIEF